MTFKTGDLARCTLNSSHSLTLGKDYEVLEFNPRPSGDSTIVIIDNDCNRLSYYSRNFTPTAQDMTYWVAEGKKFIGKECVTGVGVNAKTFTPNVLLVVVDNNIVSNYSSSVINDFKTNDYSVALYDNVKGLSFPVSHVKLVPEKFINMKLGSYESDIYKDRVVVGCQTISFLDVEKLYNHMKSLQ